MFVETAWRGAGWRVAAGALLLPILTACAIEAFDREQATREILALHEQQRHDHLEKRAADLVAAFADDYVEINRGMVRRPEANALTERFNAYFQAVDFEAWDDIEPPVVRFSDDGSLAYTVVQKRVVTRPADAATQEISGTAFAWISIYRRQQDGWRLEAIASTDRPADPEPIPAVAE